MAKNNYRFWKMLLDLTVILCIRLVFSTSNTKVCYVKYFDPPLDRNTHHFVFRKSWLKMLNVNIGTIFRPENLTTNNKIKISRKTNTFTIAIKT